MADCDNGGSLSAVYINDNTTHQSLSVCQYNTSIGYSIVMYFTARVLQSNTGMCRLALLRGCGWVQPRMLRVAAGMYRLALLRGCGGVPPRVLRVATRLCWLALSRCSIHWRPITLQSHYNTLHYNT